MKPAPEFLLDQDVYESTFRAMTDAGYRCHKALALGLAAAPDERLLAEAFGRGWVLVTRDKGFGALVYAWRERTRGVILLRMGPAEEAEVHAQLLRALSAETERGGVFDRLMTIERDKYRVRALR